jgi:thiosulfate/3-mercaptopyruvate sulfurtransferase
MKQQKHLLIYLIMIPFLLFFIGCSDDPDDDTDPVAAEETNASANSCEGCHTNYEVLKEVYTPDPPSDGGHGCGGGAPHIEPYDRVHLEGEGYEKFKAGIHGQMACTKCHNGVDGTDDKEEAHSGDFIAKPSMHFEETCGNCHTEITQRVKNSLHATGAGQKSMVTKRAGAGSGENPLEDFEQLSEMMQKGYMDNCSSCHASCGDCHVNRPAAGGGGLYDGHNFVQKPDMRDHCTTCHVSRGGHAYYGVAVGTEPDVHLTKAGFECMDCHSQNEIHGDGKVYDQRYKMPLQPECQDCHSGLESSNSYHSMHLGDFNCQVCHSQDYNNCGSCHVGGEGARIPSHIKFKIGMNPLPEDVQPFRMATLREAPHAPDSWQNYGTENLSNFDTQPTYKYTTPHNILKWTTRTAEDPEEGTPFSPCYQGCHIVEQGDSVLNKELYLFEEDLEDWEVEANQNTIVDGKLPSSWPVN